MNIHFSKSNLKKNLVALHSYLKQIRLINGRTFTRSTCLLCLAQLPRANTLNHAHTPHAASRQARCTCPILCSQHQLSEKTHFLPMLPSPPFHLNTAVSQRCHQPPDTRRGVSGRRTRLQVLRLQPAHQPR